MIRYDQLESGWICNKSSNLSVKAHKTTTSDPQWSAESHDSQTHKQGAMPAKGRRQTLATTRIMSHVLWGYPLTPETQPATSIGSILTLPKLHLAT